MPDISKIKYPKRSSTSHIEKILKGIPRDGNAHFVKEMSHTSAEQTARNLNNAFSPWEFGYIIEPDSDGDLISFLYVRSV